MSLKGKIAAVGIGWLLLISGLHAYLNVNWAAVLPEQSRCHWSRPFSKLGLPKRFSAAPVGGTAHAARNQPAAAASRHRLT